MFAGMREELNLESNREKEDRTLVIGIPEPADLLRRGYEQAEKLKVIPMEFCQRVIPGYECQVLFAATCGRPEKGKMILKLQTSNLTRLRRIGKS